MRPDVGAALSKRHTFADLMTLLGAGLLVSVGTLWAFNRGSPDFSVFYEAWRLVLEGKGPEVFGGTPDRYLYAPGFAWLLAPLGLFPRSVALALWCFGKAAALGLVFRLLARRISLAVACGALIFIARPLLIDFQYGQVNLYILCACLWALLNHFDAHSSRGQSFFAWMALAIVAVVKLFPVPLLVIPWFITQGILKEKRQIEKCAVVFGVLLVLLIPWVSESFSAFVQLYQQWRLALISRGFPLESHNQSFAALLHHYTSGEKTHVIAQGSAWLSLGGAYLEESTRQLLSLAWSFLTLGFLAGWVLRGPWKSIRWSAICVACLILPSHLVWKPYFVLSYPLVVILLAYATKAKRIVPWLGMGAFFFLINLTGFDFLGGWLAARFEAASVFLLAHLFALIWVLKIPEESVSLR